jgi:hypothetical protein
MYFIYLFEFIFENDHEEYPVVLWYTAFKSIENNYTIIIKTRTTSTLITKAPSPPQSPQLPLFGY